jgi:hypothetical protein
MQLHNNLNLIATNQLIYINLKLYQLTLNIQQPKKKIYNHKLYKHEINHRLNNIFNQLNPNLQHLKIIIKINHIHLIEMEKKKLKFNKFFLI